MGGMKASISLIVTLLLFLSSCGEKEEETDLDQLVLAEEELEELPLYREGALPQEILR